MDNIKFLTIESEVFQELRNNINSQIQKLLHNMTEKNQSEGKISINIDVKLTSEYIPNYNPDIDGETRRVLHPSFNYKTTRQITMKDDISGNYASEMELVYDDELKQYVEKFVSDTTQRSIFDADYREVVVNEEHDIVEEESQFLEGKKVYALPDNLQEEEIPFAGPSDCEEE